MRFVVNSGLLGKSDTDEIRALDGTITNPTTAATAPESLQLSLPDRDRSGEHRDRLPRCARSGPGRGGVAAGVRDHRPRWQDHVRTKAADARFERCPARAKYS